MINLIITSFLAGIITFLSPCVLPLIPAYVFYITGLKIDRNLENKKGYILNIILFITGFTIIFVVLGIITSLLLFAAKDIKFYLNIVFGIIIIIFGLHFIGILKLFFLNSDKRFDFTSIKINFFGSLLMGMAFAVGWSPCVGPILGTILGLVAIQGSLVKGVILLLIYSLGLGIPLLITALFFNYIKPLIDFLKKHSGIIKLISGVFLILIGILIVFGSLNRLNIILMNFSYILENNYNLFSTLIGIIFIMSGLVTSIVFLIKNKKLSIITAIFCLVLIITGFLILIKRLLILDLIIKYLRSSGI